jgi:hypothetical protein
LINQIPSIKITAIGLPLRAGEKWGLAPSCRPEIANNKAIASRLSPFFTS